MPLNAITQANGADLLNLLQQSQGQATTAVDASTSALKKALEIAKLSEAEVLSGDSSGASQLNVYA